MDQLSASRPDLWPRVTLSVLDLILQRHLPPLCATLQSGPSLPLLPWRIWRSTLLTSPMPISMVFWRKRSICSFLKVLRTLASLVMFSFSKRHSMDLSRLAGCGPRLWQILSPRWASPRSSQTLLSMSSSETPSGSSSLCFWMT